MEVCETVFNYVLTLTEIFPGEDSLQVADFICRVFDLSAAPARPLPF